MLTIARLWVFVCGLRITVRTCGARAQADNASMLTTLYEYFSQEEVRRGVRFRMRAVVHMLTLSRPWFHCTDTVPDVVLGGDDASPAALRSCGCHGPYHGNACKFNVSYPGA